MTFGIPVAVSENTDTLIKRSKDIIIAECVSIPTNKPYFENGHWIFEVSSLQKVEVNVIRTLKGDRQPGKQIIATDYFYPPMTPGKKYLLSNSGGSVPASRDIPGTDFLAIGPLSVVEIPLRFDLKTLDGKDLKEQIQSIFSVHLYEVEYQLIPLLTEKVAFEEAIADRQSVWFDSGGPVKIGPIVETNTISNENGDEWLNLEGGKLHLHTDAPNKTTYFRSEKMGTVAWIANWEFSTCEATNIETLAGKPLKTKFSGLFSPDAGDISNGNRVTAVSVGQVVFARSVDDPNKIFAIQIVGQDQGKKLMFARYAIIQR
jgi:hypothetical protein